MSFNEAVRRRAGERDPIEAFEATPPYEAAALLNWITLSMVPATSISPDGTSYDLRLDAENEIGFYVENDAFKGAMLAADHCPASGHALNWKFRIKRRCGRRT